MQGDGFLARIRELPDDDGPRLIFADWLDEQGDPRGEFIRVQIALARLPDHDRRRVKLLGRERDLLGRYADLWAEPFRGLATGPVFRRGFVEEVKVTARQFLAHPDAVFAAGPVSHLHLLDLGSHLVPVLAMPQLAKLSGLTVFAQHLGPPLARCVAESSYLANLTELRLGRNRLGDDGAESLANSPYLANLDELDLSENELGEVAARAIATSARLGRLRQLEVGGNAIGPVGSVALAGLPLRYLGLEGNRVGGPRLAGLTRAADLFRVEALNLAATGLTPSSLRAALTGLTTAAVEELDLGGNELHDEGAEVLAGCTGLASLRGLRLDANQISDAGVTALARAPHLDRLTVLDLSNNPIGDDGVRAVLESRTLRQLRRLIYPGIGISFRMREALELRFNRDAIARW